MKKSLDSREKMSYNSDRVNVVGIYSKKNTSLFCLFAMVLTALTLCENITDGEIIVFEENSEFYQLQVLENGEYKPFKVDEKSVITATDNVYDYDIEFLSNCSGDMSFRVKPNRNLVDDIVLAVYGREFLSARQYRLAMCGKFIVQKKWRNVLWKRLLNYGRRSYAKKETD